MRKLACNWERQAGLKVIFFLQFEACVERNSSGCFDLRLVVWDIGPQFNCLNESGSFVLHSCPALQ